MDTSNWGPPQVAEPSMDGGNWRSQMQPGIRTTSAIGLFEAFKKYFPVSRPEELNKLKQVAASFEAKVYTTATSQADYLRKIVAKITKVNSVQSHSAANTNSRPDPASFGMQPEVPNQGKPLSMPLAASQPQACQQLLSQNMQNNIPPSGVQSTAGLSSALPTSGLTQTLTPTSIGQINNMQNMSGTQNSLGNSMGQGVPSHMIANSQRQIPGRQQVVPQQQKTQNSQQYMFHQQSEHPDLKQKYQHENTRQLVPSQFQPQQQNILQPSQLQSSQESLMQPSMLDSSLSSLQQNQQSAIQQSTQAMLQQCPQSVVRQQIQPHRATVVHQQKTTMTQQQQVMAQQSNVPNMHQQQLGLQSNVTELQRQEHLGTQAVNSSMQTNQHSLQLLQQSKVQVQQQLQSASNLLLTQEQQSQPQALQQHLLSQSDSQPTQMQQSALHQQSNPLQREMQHRILASGQVSGTMLQSQNVMDQKKKFYPQSTLHEASPTSLDSTTQSGHATAGDWQEEEYQKIKVLKEMYLPALWEMYQKVVNRIQAIQEQPKAEHLDNLKKLKTNLDFLISFLWTPKSSISPQLKDKSVIFQKRIIEFINMNRLRKPVSSQQHGQLPPSHMHSMQQSQSQITQVQSHENQMSPQLQSMNLQGSVAAMQQNNVTSLQKSSMPSLSGCSTAQRNIRKSLQPSSNVVSGLGNALNSSQQDVSSAQQTSVITPPQSRSLEKISPLQSNSGVLQHQHIKQQQEQKMSQNEQKQQFEQQQLQAESQVHKHQMSQLHQVNDVNDLKMRQRVGVEPGSFHHLSTGQCAYPREEISTQLIPAASPPISQHSSPGVDQHNVQAYPKAGTPLQTTGSPFVIPSPSTPMAPSPIPGVFEKPSSASKAGNIGHQQPTGVKAQIQSLEIRTSGICTSPLHADFREPDGTHANALSTISGKSSVTEQPFERLIKAVKSASTNAFSASVGDIGSVVSMIDGVAGSEPGNGSIAAVDEDLAAMTKCRLRARNGLTDELESTAASRVKRPRIEANHALLEEIRAIKWRLIDTVVDISDEVVDPSAAAAAAAKGGKGTILKCSFDGVALSPTLKSQFASGQLTRIQPLRLLVPTDYPNCSPILLDDKFPVGAGNEDLSVKAKSRFSLSLRNISHPMSVEDIARTWDVCARAVITEHAQKSGGGSFSSRYGTWESCLSAA